MKNLALGKMPADATPEQYLAAGPWCFQDQEAIFSDFEKRFTFAPVPLARPGALPPACRASGTAYEGCRTLAKSLLADPARALADGSGKPDRGSQSALPGNAGALARGAAWSRRAPGQL